MKTDQKCSAWGVGDEAVAIVRQIFAWCMEGYGPSQIAKKLKEIKIDFPTVHWMKLGKNAPVNIPDDPYAWAPRTITGILKKQEHLGHMVNFKTHKLSYKSKKTFENRLAELGRLFKRIYEDMVNGKLSEARFQMLSDDYEQEQADLRTKIEILEVENVDRFIR